MTEFASNRNSPAEQRYLLNLIVETLGAELVEKPSGSGLERARRYAERARAQSKPEATPSPGWEQPSMWEEAA